MSQRNPDSATRVVGCNVRAEMARKGLSQRRVGEMLGISHAAVSARLSGRTPIDVNELVKIADLVEVPLDRLLDGVQAAEAVPA